MRRFVCAHPGVVGGLAFPRDVAGRFAGNATRADRPTGYGRYAEGRGAGDAIAASDERDRSDTVTESEGNGDAASSGSRDAVAHSCPDPGSYVPAGRPRRESESDTVANAEADRDTVANAEADRNTVANAEADRDTVANAEADRDTGRRP